MTHTHSCNLGVDSQSENKVTHTFNLLLSHRTVYSIFSLVLGEWSENCDCLIDKTRILMISISIQQRPLATRTVPSHPSTTLPYPTLSYRAISKPRNRQTDKATWLDKQTVADVIKLCSSCKSTVHHATIAGHPSQMVSQPKWSKNFSATLSIIDEKAWPDYSIARLRQWRQWRPQLTLAYWRIGSISSSSWLATTYAMCLPARGCEKFRRHTKERDSKNFEKKLIIIKSDSNVNF